MNNSQRGLNLRSTLGGCNAPAAPPRVAAPPRRRQPQATPAELGDHLEAQPTEVLSAALRAPMVELLTPVDEGYSSAHAVAPVVSPAVPTATPHTVEAQGSEPQRLVTAEPPDHEAALIAILAAPVVGSIAQACDQKEQAMLTCLAGLAPSDVRAIIPRLEARRVADAVSESFFATLGEARRQRVLRRLTLLVQREATARGRHA